MNARRFYCLVAVIVLGAGLAQALPAGVAFAGRKPSALAVHLQGQVTDRDTGLVLSGAQVSVPQLGLETRTNAQGFFAWFDLPLSQPSMPVTLAVSAEGYGEWVMHNLLLVAGETAQVNPELSTLPTLIDLPLPEAVHTPDLSLGERSSFEQFLTLTPDLEMPETIRVGLTGDWPCDPAAPYTAVSLDFRDYLQHVLPNEWYRNASPEAWRAGAVAVKMFAWYWINQGGKWLDPPVDLIDSTCDQYYIPGATFGPADRALEATWPWALLRDGELFQTFHKETQDCSPPNCMRQLESQSMAVEGYTWDQILEFFYPGSQLVPIDLPPAGFNLRFSGRGVGAYDRVSLPVYLTGRPVVSLPVNVGADDFTVEFWLKANTGDHAASAGECGSGADWQMGNVIFNRQRAGRAGSQWGLSLVGRRLAFGVTGDVGAPSASLTVCSRSVVADGLWRHVAVQRRRSDGWIWMFIDGKLDASLAGPAGDISFAPGEKPSGLPDSFLIIGNSRQDEQPGIASFNGWLDEVRFSSGLRYPEEGFSRPVGPFSPDLQTLALYHFDEGRGEVVRDTGGNPAGPSDGRRDFGGEIPGPDWTLSDLFIPLTPGQYLPLVVNQSP